MHPRARLCRGAPRTRTPLHAPSCMRLPMHAPGAQPTLLAQTANEFKTVCPSLNVVSVYGGTSISMQISDLRRGADVVVGTPGRVIDLIERGSLTLDEVQMCVCACASTCIFVRTHACAAG